MPQNASERVWDDIAAVPSPGRLSANLPGSIYRRVRRPDGTYYFEFLSSGLFQKFGIDYERLRNETASTFDWIHPEDLDRFIASLELSASTLRLADHRVRVVSQTGRINWVRGIAHPIQREQGYVAWDGIVIDITREVELEAALRIANGDLEEAHLKGTASLVGMIPDLRASLNEVGMLQQAIGQTKGPQRLFAQGLERCRSRLEKILGRLADSEEGAELPLGHQRDQNNLTRRQREVLRCLVSGMSNKSIAQKLGITPGTAKIHVASILKSLNLKSRRELRAD